MQLYVIRRPSAWADNPELAALRGRVRPRRR